MNQFLGIKVKRLFVVLLFVPLCMVPSICSAVNACVSGTPILKVIAPNPRTPGGNVSYFGTAIGYGFATYEIVASDVGILRSGTFSSGQTVSGNYKTPSGGGTLIFRIKDSGGNVIHYCDAAAFISGEQDMCVQEFKERGPKAKIMSGLQTSKYWGGLITYRYCSRKPSSSSVNYQANSLNLGLLNSGSVRNDQMVIGCYRIPFGPKKETYTFTTPGYNTDSWLTWSYYTGFYDTGFSGSFRSWATGARPCNASFSLWGDLTAYNTIQFDANNANIDWYRPDNYKWKVDGADYLQGNDKNVVYGSFSAGPHTVSLTVDDGLGTSCSSSRTITIPIAPSCSVSGMSATPSTVNFGTNVNFTGNISGTGIVSYIWKDGATLLGVNVAMPGIGGVAANNHIFAGAANITKTITLIGTLSDGKTCQGNVLVNLTPPPPPPPPPCTVDFDAKSGTESCLTGDCNYNEPIRFFVSTSSGPITDYTWKMNKPSGVAEAFADSIITGASVTSVSKTFYPADGKTHTVRLLSHDSNGNTCTMDKTINVQLGMPGWNEIAPYLMQLLGPIGFLGVVLLSRAIFLWL